MDQSGQLSMCEGGKMLRGILKEDPALGSLDA